ncbi:hypothetical protein Droror1_Dr00016466 [Drosera rotundifolia]
MPPTTFPSSSPSPPSIPSVPQATVILSPGRAQIPAEARPRGPSTRPRPSSHSSPSFVLSPHHQEHDISAPIEPTTWMQLLPPELRPSVAPPASTPAPPASTPAREDNESDDEEQNT